MRYLARLAVFIAMTAANLGAGAQTLPAFDFRKPDVVEQWRPAHDVSRLEAVEQGMRIDISGGDPYVHGPARDYPANQPLWLHIRFRSDQPGTGQVFWFTTEQYAREENSVHFPARGEGRLEDVRVPIPPLWPATMLRLDPPGTGGSCTVVSISFEARNLLKEPAWPKPSAPTLGRNPLVVRSGDLALIHSRTQLGGFVLNVAGKRMAAGHTRPLIGYEIDGKLRWLDLARSLSPPVIGREPKGGLVVLASATDPDRARWTILHRFAPGRPGAINVETTVSVSRPRTVVYLPMVTLLPGVGSFAAAKGHALLAGLEYLDGKPTEVSSSQADIEGPLANRRVPDSERITFPLMAVQANHAFVGLIWDKKLEFSALFDSPDRTFHGGGHLMGVIFPGSDGSNRVEGSLLPYAGVTIGPGPELKLRATLIGGKGESIVPCVQQYVSLRGLPPLPTAGMDVQQYVRWAAGGWLDSKVRDGEHFRHAYWPGASFGPGPAADAALFMAWLAASTKDAALAERLRSLAADVTGGIGPGDWNFSGVSHVHYPAVSLIFGHVEENADRAEQGARDMLSQFDPDGAIRYRRRPDGLDYGRTHYEPTANGLTAPVTAGLLEAAAISGDRALVGEALKKLRALDRWTNTAPRGAQTWEVPLHTPDILASAHLVKAYTLGYALSGDPHFLEQARYWAWTGVPFTYLVNPTPQPVGPYATTPVFGATQWKAPDWMGLPVQWCGLVYSDALYRLARYDIRGPWKKLADGITISGIQQSFPASDRDLQGLLPDSFNVRPQTRNGVAINPGTVQANAAQLFGAPLYDFRAFRSAGILVHAPGEIVDAKDATGQARFRVRSFAIGGHFVLISGVRGVPTVRLNGQIVTLTEPNSYSARTGRLVLRLSGEPTVEVSVR